jgi:hypothetical protein
VRWTDETTVAKANGVAEKAGYNLKDYDDPKMEISSYSDKIKIAYTHKDPAPPGSRFTVGINIGSGWTELVKEE